MFAAAMLAADPVTSGVYYVDDHFVPYAGAKPVAKGWNNKRGRAERGRADTHVTAHDGRAVCFVTGEPSGLTATLPKALAELKKAAGPGAKIMLGFDRGGAYPQVFRHCRDQDVHWVTYRRAPLAVPAKLPVITTITYAGRTRQIGWAEETVQLKDYGEARQITLFEHGKVALQILTSDLDACPAEILAWLKSRWREENFLKYASENYGIDKICDYLASIETNTKMSQPRPQDQANAAVRDAEKALAAAERASPSCSPTPASPPPPRTTASPPRRRTSPRPADTWPPPSRPASRSPPNCPPTASTPTRRPRCCAPAGAACRWSCGSWPTTPSTGSRTTSTPTSRDDDEYRAITRETIIRGLAGTITCTPAAITVTLQRPASPRVTRALTLLTDEINATPPAMPGDTRPITYQITPHPAFNTNAHGFAGDLGSAGINRHEGGDVRALR